MNNKGFTLIEVLISIMIMAFIAASTYELMSGAISSSQTVEENTDALHEFQKAINIMNQDFSQMVPRVFRLDGTETRSVIQVGENAFQSDGTGITFSRGGALNPGALLPRGEVIRVWYRLKNGALERATYPYPDTIVGFEPEFHTLLKGVKSFRVYFYKQGAWSMGWLDRTKISNGVKIEFETENYGKISRMYYVIAGAR